MNPRLATLALAKQRLVLRSDELRRQFAAAATNCKPALGVVDRLREGVDWLRRHPSLPVALLVALIVARPRAVLRLAGRAWLAWRALRGLSARLQVVKSLGVGLGRDRKVGTTGAGGQRASR